MSRRVLVTGGSGFIGAAVVRKLVERGNNVSVLDDYSRGNRRRLRGIIDDLNFIDADIRDQDCVVKACSGMDAVVHLAFINGTEFFYSKPDVVLDVAVRGMLNILEGCRLGNVPDFLLASSSEVYQTPSTIPTSESVPMTIPDVLNPRYSYGGGKIICELMALNYNREIFRRLVIFRPHNVYGADMGWEHVMPELSMQAIRQAGLTSSGPINICVQGDGSQTRAFVYIDDAAEAVCRLLDAGEHRTIYNIGTNEEVPISKVIGLIGKSIGRIVEIDSGPMPIGGTMRRCPNIDRLNNLGHFSQVSLEDGVRRLVEWYSDNQSLWPNRIRPA